METVASSVTSTKQLINLGFRFAEERDGSGSLTRQFFRRGQIVGATNYFYFKDQLGSIREMTDAAGSAVSSYTFDPFGRVASITSTVESDLGFGGYYRHRRSNLDLALFRIYSAALGRWISRDPIREKGGLNMYAYAGNMPVRKLDPTGLSCNNFDDDENYPPDEDDWLPWLEIPSYTTDPHMEGVFQLPRPKRRIRLRSFFKPCKPDSDPQCCEENRVGCGSVARIVNEKFDLSLDEFQKLIDCCDKAFKECEEHYRSGTEYPQHPWEDCFKEYVIFTK